MTKKNTNIKIKPGFLSDLDTRVISENKFELLNPLKYHTKKLSVSKRDIVVPAGFQTDFASFFIIKFGEKSATLHDYLYASHLVSRKKADEIFLEALETEGVSYWRRYSCYYGVRAFGWMHY